MQPLYRISRISKEKKTSYLLEKWPKSLNVLKMKTQQTNKQTNKNRAKIINLISSLGKEVKSHNEIPLYAF